MADEVVRRAILDRLAATPFGSLARREVIDSVVRSAVVEGLRPGEAEVRIRREAAAMVADRLLGPAGEGMWRLTDAGRGWRLVQRNPQPSL